jgi:hypothetical protein
MRAISAATNIEPRRIKRSTTIRSLEKAATENAPSGSIGWLRVADPEKEGEKVGEKVG